MLQSIMKNFFTVVCSIYIYKKLLNIKNTTFKELSALPFALTLSYLMAYIRMYLPALTIILLAFFFSIYCFFIYKKDILLTLTVTTISIGISYFFYAVSVMIYIPVASILYINIKNSFIMSIIGILSGGLGQSILCFILFKIRKFKNGIPDLEKNNISDTAVYISVILLLASSLIYLDESSFTISLVLIFFTILFGLTIFLWWRKRLSDKYINKVYERNIRILEDTLSTQKTEIENLSKIIHKDNKVPSALRLAVNEQYSNNGENSAELQNLLNEITHLEDERKECLTNYEQTTKILAKTGVFSTDMIINYLLKRANKESIIFDVSITGDIPYMVSDAIDTYDLNTMLADLGENAIIATSHSAVKNVLLIIGYRENTAFFDIYDSGSEFDAGVIANIGKKRHTTHKDTGGSGIGLMTTYELINKYHATFEIEELYDNKLFTKRVSVLFDNNSRIAIYSNRPEIIAACKSRSDIQLHPIP